MYPSVLGRSVIPAVDLLDPTSAANVDSEAGGIGKRKGTMVYRETFTDLELYVSRGNNPDDVWEPAVHSAAVQTETDPVFAASEAASFITGDKTKLDGIEAGAEVNNISDVNATDLTDAGATTLHKHDHGNIDGLTDDDHTQYARLGGRSAAQEIRGQNVELTSSAPGLKLRATGNASGGTVQVGNAYFDEPPTSNGNRRTSLRKVILDTHPEGGATIDPYKNNDLAFLEQQGGSVAINLDQSNAYKLFDVSGVYWSNNIANLPVGGVVIEITLPWIATYSMTLGISFGADAWRFKGIVLEVYSVSAADWVTVDTASNYLYGMYACYYNSDSSGITKIRFTLTDPNGYSNQMRIGQVFLQRHNSSMMHSSWLSKAGGSLYGPLSIKEQAAANTDAVAYGQIWVKSTTPNELWFTDDTGVDGQLGTIGAAAGNVAQINQAETSVASATSITLGTTLNHLITGATAVETINGVAGVTNHCLVATGFDLVHSAGLNCLQTGATITTEAGDTFDVYQVTASTVQIKNYVRASGRALVPPNVLTENLNFVGYKAIAMACDNGVSFPGTPSYGQWFLRSDINTLFQYIGSLWVAIVSFSPVTVYIDASASDDTGDGFSSSTAKKTMQAGMNAIPMLFAGDVLVEVAGGDYTSENVTLTGKTPAGAYTITINCAMAVDLQTTLSTNVHSWNHDGEFNYIQVQSGDLTGKSYDLDETLTTGQAWFVKVSGTSGDCYNLIRYTDGDSKIYTQGTCNNNSFNPNINSPVVGDVVEIYKQTAMIGSLSISCLANVSVYAPWLTVSANSINNIINSGIGVVSCYGALFATSTYNPVGRATSLGALSYLNIIGSYIMGGYIFNGIGVLSKVYYTKRGTLGEVGVYCKDSIIIYLGTHIKGYGKSGTGQSGIYPQNGGFATLRIGLDTTGTFIYGFDSYGVYCVTNGIGNGATNVWYVGPKEASGTTDAVSTAYVDDNSENFVTLGIDTAAFDYVLKDSTGDYFEITSISSSGSGTNDRVNIAGGVAPATGAFTIRICNGTNTIDNSASPATIKSYTTSTGGQVL